MGARLLTEDEVRSLTRSRIRSHDWWVFVAPAGSEGFLSLIEEKHYTGAASAGFELFLLPGLSIAFARKSFMSPAALARITAEAGGMDLPAEVYEKHDILFPAYRPGMETLARTFHNWVLEDGRRKS